MRVISIWQPYASLLVLGFKVVETRPYFCPASVVKTRLGIASTKMIKPDQRAAFENEHFQRFYRQTGLPATLEELPNGFLLGSVFVNSTDPIDEDDLEDTTDEELAFGDWRLGRHAWRCRDPQVLDEPVPVRGQQGIWTLNDATILQFGAPR